MVESDDGRMVQLIQRPHFFDQAGLVEEMRSLDQLHHPAVVTFYHHFVNEQLLFLVMEYCAVGSLRSRMQLGAAPLQTSMQWGKELAETLDFVHRQGIVH